MIDRRSGTNPDVYVALISDLAYSAVATTIMSLTLIVVGLLALLDLGDGFFGLTMSGGAAGMAGKLALMRSQRRRMSDGVFDFADARIHHDRHMIVTLVTAASVSVTAVLLFLSPDVRWHALGTALLFAYCAGVVGRLSVSPVLAGSALLVAALPVIAACASWNDAPHRVTAILFAVFLSGSFETVRHVYRRAARHITTELDMATLARNDPLTGLLNRLGLREAFRSMTATRTGLAVHCLDLDGFKGVNDAYGHAAGDRVLTEVGRRIVAAAPAMATARLGGDEYAVLQSDVRCEQDASLLAERLQAALSKPFAIGTVEIRLGVSLGFTVMTEGVEDLDAMLRIADLASYQIKRTGGGVAQGYVDDGQGLVDDGRCGIA